MWQTPLSDLVANYEPHQHPIVGPLLKGGPHCLAEKYDINLENDAVDECHFCYQVRRLLLDRFPEYLGPRQVYGLE